MVTQTQRRTFQLCIDQLDICAGSFVVLTGPTGVGKSTLGRIVVGLQQPSAVDQLTVVNYPLHDTTPQQRERFLSEAVGIATQTPELLVSLTVLENVELPLRLQGITKSRSAALEVLRSLSHERDLVNRVNARITELSGGQRQRVALARALLKVPPILFLDEPTSNLDGETAHRALAAINRLRREAGTTVLMITQHPERAAIFATRHIHIDVENGVAGIVEDVL